MIEWIIEAPLLILKSLCGPMGLPPHAIYPAVFRLDANDGEPAQLVFPSFGCPSPTPWLMVLFSLLQKKIPFQLYQRKKEKDAVIALLRLHPRIDPALLAAISGIIAAPAGQLAAHAIRIEKVFERLRGEDLG
ncbi:MAG: hypothetical protein V2B19_21145 [Pseudomonadota bacterium]